MDLPYPDGIVESNQMLINAMSSHNLTLAAFLIHRGADPDTFWNGNPILQYGILGGCFELVRNALLFGADAKVLDRDGDRMLHLAAEEGFVEAAAMLLEFDNVNSSDDNGNTTIYYALKDPDYNMVSLLLRAGALINVCNRAGETPLHFVLNRKPSVWSVRELLRRGALVNFRNYAGQSPLDIALYRANGMTLGFFTPIIAELLSWGATIHKASKTAFHFLVSYPRCTLRLVTQYISIEPDLVNTRDQFNCTPLHYASQSGREDVVRELIKSGAKVNAVDNDGCTPLHYAATHEKILQELILNGADVDKRNNARETPLHVAIKSHNQTSGPVRVLLYAGADTHAIDIEGRTPFEYVCRMPNDPSMVVLLQYSIFENYTKEKPYPHDKRFWLTHARFFCLPLVLEIESLKCYNVADQVSLFNVLMSDDWDVIYTPKIFGLMNSQRFPYYWDIVLSKLSIKVEEFMKDPYTDVQRFLRDLSRKSSFVTNIDCFLGIAQHLNNIDCLNFYLAGSSSGEV